MAVLATLVAAPAAAQDQEPHAGLPDGVLVREKPNGQLIVNADATRFYGSFESPQYLVLAGFDMYDVCFTDGPTLADAERAIATQTRNGTWKVKPRGGSVDVVTSVYETELDAFAFFDAVCGAAFEEGTPPPAPFATGLTQLWYRETRIRDLVEYLDPTTPQPQGRYDNGTSGVVSDRDGNLYDLEARADFVVTARGTFKFAELRADLTPQAP